MKINLTCQYIASTNPPTQWLGIHHLSALAALALLPSALALPLPTIPQTNYRLTQPPVVLQQPLNPHATQLVLT